MNSELDRIFEQGLSDLTRTPKTPLSDEQIATAAKASRIGVVLWLRMHVKEILLCAISLVVGIGCTLLVLHFTGVQRVAPEPEETVAAVVCDTAMVADDTTLPPVEPTTSIVETRHGASLQPMSSSVQPQSANPQTDAPNVTRHKSLSKRHTSHVRCLTTRARRHQENHRPARHCACAGIGDSEGHRFC